MGKAQRAAPPQAPLTDLACQALVAAREAARKNGDRRKDKPKRQTGQVVRPAGGNPRLGAFTLAASGSEPSPLGMYWRYRQYMTAKGMNVPFTDEDELETVRAAAKAAGLSTREYIRQAALNQALAVPTAFLDAALQHQERIRDAFAEVFPEDAAPKTGYGDAEAEAARRLAEPDGGQTHGTAA